MMHTTRNPERRGRIRWYWMVLLPVALASGHYLRGQAPVPTDPTGVAAPELDSLFTATIPLFQQNYAVGSARFDSIFRLGYAAGLPEWVGPRKVKIATFDVYFNQLERGYGRLWQVYQHPNTRRDTALLTNVLTELAQYHTFYGTPDSTRYYLEATLALIDTVAAPTDYAAFLYQRGVWALQRQDYTAALKDYMAALRIYDRYEQSDLDRGRVVGITIDIGILLVNTNQLTDAMMYMERAAAYFEPGDPGYGAVASRAAVVAAQLAATDKARQYIEEVDRQVDATAEDRYYEAIARAYLAQRAQQPGEVDAHVRTAAALLSRVALPLNRHDQYRLQAYARAGTRQYAALERTVDSMRAVSKTPLELQTSNAWQQQATFLQRYPEVDYLELDRVLGATRAVGKAQQQLELSDLEARYQNTLKDRQLQEQSERLANETLRRQRITLLLGLLSLLAIGLVGGVWTTRRNNQRLRNLNAALDREKRTVQELHQELSHRVKNNFSFLIGMLSLQRRRLGGINSQQVLLDMEKRIGVLAEVHELLQHQAVGINTPIAVADYLDRMARLFEEFYLDRINRLNVRTQVQLGELSIDRMSIIGLIVNELLANTVKHTTVVDGQRWAHINLYPVDASFFELEYHDHAGAIPDLVHTRAKGYDSMGAELIRLMVQQLQGTLKVADGKVVIRGRLRPRAFGPAKN